MTVYTYTDFAEEFGRLVADWDKLEGYATDAIIRDAFGRFAEFREYWENCAIADGTSPIYAFVTNYIEVVKNVPMCYPGGKRVVLIDMWTIWGTTLRLLEINDK